MTSINQFNENITFKNVTETLVSKFNDEFKYLNVSEQFSHLLRNN